MPPSNSRHRSGREWRRIRSQVLAGQPAYCYLCQGARGPIRYDVKYPHPLSPTVDHVIPASTYNHLPDAERKAALHDLRNLKPAHKKCNDEKQNSAAPLSSMKANPGSTDWYSNDD